jgi:pSer/pThr/pTyr-binding forkhead associated (FHA) protein
MVELLLEDVTLGRGADNRLSFPEDRGLSRHHLVMDSEKDRWRVRDLDGKNGTFVETLSPSDTVVDIEEKIAE